MDISKYIVDINIPAIDEPQAIAFLSTNRDKLQENILNLWEEFVAAENDKLPGSVKEDKLTPDVIDTQIPVAPSKGDQAQTTTVTPAEKPSGDAKREITQNEELALQIKNKFITLPNGKVGQHYNFVFSTEKIGIADIEDFWFEGLDPVGLKFNTLTDTISGVPTVSGEQSIRLFLKRKGWCEGKPVFERNLTLTVNPDPRSLWLNKPSDQSDPYWKPDSNTQFLKVESIGLILKKEQKDIVAASQRGRSHAHEGIFRDDDFGMDYDKNTNWYIIAVADGAGSCKASRKGSQIACKSVVEVSKTQLERQHKEFEHLIKELSKEGSEGNRKKMGDALYGILGTAVFKAYKNIEEEAIISGKPVKDFSTTLIVSICKKFKFGWFVAAFWVGDGGVGIYDKNRRFLRVLGESDGGEFAGQTRFLTMPEITQPTELYRRLRFDIVEDFTALILMSDGITDPKFETDANLFKLENWDELWDDLSKEVEFKDNNEKSAEQLLKWLDFWSPGNHDDRTIAILF
jgi:serine/threonine protein phosphatase PrpC